jgi:ABC-type phosphate transport system substrate-binding protein
MRVHALAPLLVGLSIAAIGVGCGRSSGSSSPDLTSPTSSAPGTLVKQPLGASSVNGAGSSRPAPVH